MLMDSNTLARWIFFELGFLVKFCLKIEHKSNWLNGFVRKKSLK